MKRTRPPLPTFDELAPRLRERVQEGMARYHLDCKPDDAPPIVIDHIRAHASKVLNYVQNYLDTSPEDSVRRFETKDMMLGAYRRDLAQLQALGISEELQSPDHLDEAVRIVQQFLTAQHKQLRAKAKGDLAQNGGDRAEYALRLFAEDEHRHGGYAGSDPSQVKPYITKAGKEIDPDTLVHYFTDSIAKDVFEEVFRAVRIPDHEWVADAPSKREWADRRLRFTTGDDGGNGRPPRSRAG